MRVLSLCVGLFAVIGCSEKKGGNVPGGSEPAGTALVPITETDVKEAVAEMVSQNQGFYPTKAKSVELLSPLLTPSEQFFTKNPSYDRNSVACYTLVICESRPGSAVHPRYDQFVVVIRNNGKMLQKNVGKLSVPINILDISVIKSQFGDEWYAKHPRPAVPK